MESVYLETSFISYLVSIPARDLVIAAHQQVTHEWWKYRKHDFRCVISQVVIDEISAGDRSEAKKRLDSVASLEVLSASSEAETLAAAILEAGILPLKAARDAAHIAVSTVHGVQYLLTWNCKHIANAQIGKRIDRVCAEHGYKMTVICTPEELLQELSDDE